MKYFIIIGLLLNTLSAHEGIETHPHIFGIFHIGGFLSFIVAIFILTMVYRRRDAAPDDSE
ncbi:MAG: hypothetical protein U9R27_00665 [Campylobacterota bacterium]|nr:hypothetical protein [Campylobacterota bacterium]